MDDNTRAHTAIIVHNVFQEVGISVMQWLDINPMEHLWGNLKRKVWSRDPTPMTLQEIAIIEKWNTITQELILWLVKSMSDIMETVTKAQGAVTFDFRLVLK